ncbi:MAG: endonuclease III domain-containing protein [Saccharofermentanales bacterium]|jgi:endonuclease-3 related protein|nr:endonuclease III domain-containing protein [Clostridiaceae bacterium]
MGGLKKIYQTLCAHYGDLDWWPADTPFEVMVGAVLTQNTAWTNVEKAFQGFDGHLSPERILNLPMEELQRIIRPAGFYKQKSQYLKAVTKWFMRYDCDINAIKNRPLPDIRSELLQVRGIGNETADSILLYAFDFPTFVVDAYTMRLFERFPVDAGKTYMEVKSFCETELPRDKEVYGHFHALIVHNGKEHCKKKMDCAGCPLKTSCKKKLFEGAG